ncbi:MAG: hypothetical protein MI923_16745 [Phycisphaerales bacterium]|nr:hypothetical protein [Phycisphaerales bacterium]
MGAHTSRFAAGGTRPTALERATEKPRSGMADRGFDHAVFRRRNVEKPRATEMAQACNERSSFPTACDCVGCFAQFPSSGEITPEDLWNNHHKATPSGNRYG